MKNTIKNKINVKTALDNALNYSRLDRREVRLKESTHEHGLYYLAYSTDWLNYECYVDDSTGEVLGMSYYTTTEEQRREQLTSGRTIRLKSLLAAAI